MKKVLALLLCLIMVFSLAACSKKKDDSGSKGDETGGLAESGSVEDDGNYTLESVADYVTLGDYKNVEVTKVSTDVTDEQVEAQIQTILSYYAETEQIKEGAVKEGDTVNIAFVGKMDGEAFDGGSSESYDLTIGSNSFIEGFESGLIGVNVGETVDLNLTFPDPYQNNPDYSGKPVVFTVTVNYIAGESIIPELNDEFAQNYNSNYQTVEDMRAGVRKDLEETAASNAESAQINEAWNKVMEASEISEYPEDMVQEYIDAQRSQYETYATYYGYEDLESYVEANGSTMEEFESTMQEYCKSLVKSELVFRAIAEKEGFEVTADSYSEAAESYAGQYGYEDAASFIEAVGKTDLIKQIIWEQVIDLVMENATMAEAESTAAPETSAAENATVETTE